jgi:hypothetical protein
MFRTFRLITVAAALVTAFCLVQCDYTDCNFDGKCPQPSADTCRLPETGPEQHKGSCGITVSSAHGSDSPEGYKTEFGPFRTLAAAVARAKELGKPRVYICDDGPLEAPPLTIDAAGIILTGHCRCRPEKNSPMYCGYDPEHNSILSFTTTDAAGVTFANAGNSMAGLEHLEVRVSAATEPGSSAIAVSALNSSYIFFRNSRIVAADGRDAAPVQSLAGLPPATNGTPSVAGGAECRATCSDGDTVGGAGGTNAEPGASGLPDLGGTYPDNGGGGQGGTTCTPGGNGVHGTDGAAGASPTVGSIVQARWVGGTGPAGQNGTRGQGGGGGGSKIPPGGGGACGGCGGSGGPGGNAGGASIAVIASASTVVMSDCTLTTGKGGKGSDGAAGQPGQVGGTGGESSGTSCPGGDGGRGGRGGAGLGGAGGISVGVVSKGAVVSRSQNVTITPGAAGLGGTEGIAGISKDVFEAP